jgi:Mg2+-importing ATPase
VVWAPDRPDAGPARPADSATGPTWLASSGPTGGSGLGEYAQLPLLRLLRRLSSTPRGLAEDDAQARLARCGDNALTPVRPAHWGVRLLRTARDPFAAVLLGLDLVSAATGNLYSTMVITFLVLASCALRFL